MSIRVMTEVWKTNLPTTEKMVLLVIADHASDDGTNAWPSQATIAAKCSISVRTVQRSVNTLVRHGYIRLEKRAGGSVDCREDRRPNRYTIVLSRLRGDNTPRRKVVANEVTLTPDTGRQSRPMNHTKQPSIELSQFNEFWKMYPLKKAKGKAQEAYAKALKKATHDEIMAGVRKYSKDPLRDPKFTAYPATWLNQERWLDEITEVKERVIAESYNPEIHGPNKDAIPMPKEIRDMLRNALKKVD
jgi:Mn-dependent DtxR family transcriptional regulator